MQIVALFSAIIKRKTLKFGHNTQNQVRPLRIIPLLTAEEVRKYPVCKST